MNDPDPMNATGRALADLLVAVRALALEVRRPIIATATVALDRIGRWVR